jgi:hypothetical protein
MQVQSTRDPPSGSFCCTRSLTARCGFLDLSEELAQTAFVYRSTFTNQQAERRRRRKRRGAQFSARGEDIRTSATGKFMDQKKACGEEV